MTTVKNGKIFYIVNTIYLCRRADFAVVVDKSLEILKNARKPSEKPQKIFEKSEFAFDIRILRKCNFKLTTRLVRFVNWQIDDF